MAITYELHDDYDHCIGINHDDSTKENVWNVISWLKDFHHAPATTVISLYNLGLYADCLKLYDRSKF